MLNTDKNYVIDVDPKQCFQEQIVQYYTIIIHGCKNAK